MTARSYAEALAELADPGPRCRHCRGRRLQWRAWQPSSTTRVCLWWCSDCERPAHSA